MSLTSFINEPDVRIRFRQEFNKPRFSIRTNILTEPLSKRYSLVGTAFDYLLRFYVRHLNAIAIQKPWVAHLGLKSLKGQSSTINYDLDTVRLRHVEDTRIPIARRILQRAESNCKRYLSSGDITSDLIKSAIHLAQLDVIFRSGFVDDNLGVAYEEDVEDLQKMISLVDPHHVKANEVCLLNPTFGGASFLVGGADADLLIDKTLIDIKVTKIPRIDRNYFNQLIGYFILHWLHSIGNISPKPKIFKIGIYFARYAHLEVYDLKDLINQKTFSNFVRWFVERAKQQYPKHFDVYIEHKWNSIVAAN